MAFDQNTRNKLQRFVSNARALLAEEFTRQLQENYGIDPATGRVSPLDKLTHLDDGRRETARMLRETLDHYRAVAPSGNTNEVLDRIIREQAFTVLNRLCAVRMAEARGIIIESIANGYNSKGFHLFNQLARTALGEVGDAYRSYLFSVFDEFAVDLPVLFDRYSPLGRLFPKPEKLISGNPSKPGLIEMMNSEKIAPLWAEDETIGWIYQYFNSAEERRQMRKESSAPRNSRELAVRNQFFTPRYVVEFLTDNTLGRIWYEMTKGETALKETCRYLVRRPMEIFLAEGEEAPEEKRPSDDLSQEELLKQPVYIPHRPLKDPREILLLDPACGSMHFGLYAFDLFEKIYEEAWELEEKHGKDALLRSKDLKPLRETYSTREDLLRDVPRLIIEYNIHGIDIDPRAVQIAGLSLWLRAQRSWKEQATDPAKRPQIRRSNVVCAEPMPGEKEFLEEFIETHLSAGPELKLLGQIVRRVFDAMKLAGEAGSLLKIEEEISEVVAEAKKKWQSKPQLPFSFKDIPTYLQEGFDLDVSRISDEAFWEKAEERIYAALQKYAEEAENGDGYQRRLFAEDAARGFAFIAVCRKRYDVVVMNPPFGEASAMTQPYFHHSYPEWNFNLFCCFITRALGLSDFLGAITDRTYMLKTSYENFRRKWYLKSRRLEMIVDLGWGVLDANVEVNLQIFRPSSCSIKILDLSNIKENRSVALLNECSVESMEWLVYEHDHFLDLPNVVISYRLPQWQEVARRRGGNIASIFATAKSGLKPGRVEQFVRLLWEIPENLRGTKKRWNYFQNGSPYAPYYYPTVWVIDYRPNWQHIKAVFSSRITGLEYFWLPGVSYGKRTDCIYCYPMPKGQIFSNEGMAIFPNQFNDIYSLLGFVNSPSCQTLINLLTGQHKAHSYFNKIALLTPIRDYSISKLAKFILSNLQKVEMISETSLNFIMPFPKGYACDTLPHFTSTITFINQMINQAQAAYQTSAEKIANFLDDMELVKANSPDWVQLFFEYPLSPYLVEINLVSYFLGITFGRWDIRYATDEKQPPELPDPFAPLPVCPPGMLQNEQGLPARPEDVPADYSVNIPWEGIIVDDPGHPLDIERRVREVIEIIWKERAEDIEHEACEILGVKSLREYFCKPTGFFADHLKRYSKSRRQAPIYWPLSTASGSYTLWVYYHRLTDQTLYTCVNDFVEPKLRQVTESSNELRRKKSRSSQEEKELERLSDLEVELKDFRDELLRVARFWKPNLNDGVQITAAPLWKLFRLAKWQKKLKDTWERLERGEYDWAHLACNIWPERVVRLAQKDRSIAIAHDLEDELWEEIVESGRRGGQKGKWVPKKLSEAELRKIIQEKTG